MAFEIVEIPSGGLFIKGHLIQKKLTAKSKRMVFLCFPKSLKDVQFLFEELKSGTNQNQAKDMEIYGHISLAAISGFPLLVIGTTAQTYIHFSQIQGLYDEQDLGQACSFSILTAQTEFRFVSETSFSYQKWVGALTQAFENMSQEQLQPAPNDGLPPTPHGMPRNPDDYIQVHRALSTNRESRRSVSRSRKSVKEVDPNENYYYENMYYTGAPPKQKETVFTKVKKFFSGFGKKKSNYRDEYRGRDPGPVYGYPPYDEYGMYPDEYQHQYSPPPPLPPPKDRPRRRKSMARYLGIESEE